MPPAGAGGGHEKSVLTVWIVVGRRRDLLVNVVSPRGGAFHGGLAKVDCRPLGVTSDSGDQGHHRLAPDAVMPQRVDPFQAHLLFAGQVKVLQDDVGVLTALPLQVYLRDGRSQRERGVFVHGVEDFALDLGDGVTVQDPGLIRLFQLSLNDQTGDDRVVARLSEQAFVREGVSRLLSVLVYRAFLYLALDGLVKEEETGAGS